MSLTDRDVIGQHSGVEWVGAVVRIIWGSLTLVAVQRLHVWKKNPSMRILHIKYIITSLEGCKQEYSAGQKKYPQKQTPVAGVDDAYCQLLMPPPPPPLAVTFRVLTPFTFLVLCSVYINGDQDCKRKSSVVKINKVGIMCMLQLLHFVQLSYIYMSKQHYSSHML